MILISDECNISTQAARIKKKICTFRIARRVHIAKMAALVSAVRTSAAYRSGARVHAAIRRVYLFVDRSPPRGSRTAPRQPQNERNRVSFRAPLNMQRKQ